LGLVPAQVETSDKKKKKKKKSSEEPVIDSSIATKFIEDVKNKEKIEADRKYIKGTLLLNRFVSGMSMALGMIGTVIGLIMMFAGVDHGIDPENYQANIQLLKAVSAGFAVALYTTLVGLVSSLLLAIQSFNIDYELKKESKDDE